MVDGLWNQANFFSLMRTSEFQATIVDCLNDGRVQSLADVLAG